MTTLARSDDILMHHAYMGFQGVEEESSAAIHSTARVDIVNHCNALFFV